MISKNLPLVNPGHKSDYSGSLLASLKRWFDYKFGFDTNEFIWFKMAFSAFSDYYINVIFDENKSAKSNFKMFQQTYFGIKREEIEYGRSGIVQMISFIGSCDVFDSNGKQIVFYENEEINEKG